MDAARMPRSHHKLVRHVASWPVGRRVGKVRRAFAPTRSLCRAAAVAMAALVSAPALADAPAAETPETKVAQATPPAATPAPAPAAQAPPAVAEPKPQPWYEQLSFNAFIESGYLYNLDRPSTRKNVLRVFDAEDNTFSVSVAELTLQKTASSPGDLGFRTDLDFGGVLPGRTVSSGDLPGNFDLRQAYASWIAPVGSGLRLDAGKFVTHVGYEVIDGWDNYNDNYSRSFLFNYAIPFTHTGAKLSYTFSPQVTVMGMVANGWDSTLSRTRGKTVGAQLALTPIEPLTVYVNYLGGSEMVGDGPQTAFRQVFDVVAVYKATPWLTLGANGDYGTEDGTSLASPGQNAKWWGGAGYVKLEAPAGYGIAVRAECFRDQGGTRTGLGVPVTVYEGTITPYYKFANRFGVRAELRIDRSEDAIFPKNDGSLGNVQPTVAVNTFFVF
jgi:Putative beta-barrel porin-2, OmpL-like. bbp2